MQLLFATTNRHKLKEMRALLSQTGVVLVSLSDLAPSSVPDAPVEDGGTFEDNARLKASYYARATGRMCLADDSGLEVDALGGAPGVHSARYAGFAGAPAERDRKNREKLLKDFAQLGPDADRAARLVCVLCLCDPKGTVLFSARGHCQGSLIDVPRGTFGFGYDVHLLLPELDKTAAELTPEEWNPLSHRGRAAARLCDFLAGHPSEGGTELG